MNEFKLSKKDVKKMKSEKDIKGLINALRYKDSEIRAQAALSLVKIGNKRAVAPLIKVLKDDDLSVRENAAWALGEIGDKRAVEPLINALKYGEGDYDEAFFYINVVDSLGEIGDKRAIKQLIQVLENGISGVRHGLVEVSERAAYVLGKMGDKRAVKPLIRTLLKDDRDDPPLKEYAAWALGWIGDKRAVKSLIQMLEDEYSIVRISAANSLGEIGDKRAIKPLLRVHKDDENKDVKNAVEEALLWIFENGKYRRISNFDKLRENDRVEFKSSLRWDIKKNCVNKELQKSVAKTIAAFLNTNGGTLFIGVEDDCSINGIENDINSLKSKSIDDFEQSLIQVIVNYLGAKIIPDYIKIDYDKEEGKTICKVKVKRSLKAVFLKCKKRKYFYIRVGNTTRYLDVEETHSYIDEHFESVK